MSENKKLDPVEVLRKKNPFMYKATSMAGIAYFDNEDLVEPFINEATDYIKRNAEAVLAGRDIILKYPIPKEAKDLDKKIAALALDVKQGTTTSEMVGIRMKSLFEEGISLYKDYTKLYSPADTDLQSIERISGVFDLIMSLQVIAEEADEKL